MTQTLGDLERTVRQVDNDAQATYQLLIDIWATQQRMENRVRSLEEEVQAIAQDLTEVLELVRDRG